MPIGLKGNADGSGAVQIGGSDAISISTALNTTFAGTVTATGTVAGSTGTLYPLVADTVRTATGTAIDFTGIPSWARRITVMFNGVSTNGTSNILIQLGTSTGFVTTGYASTSINGTAAVAISTSTAGQQIVAGSIAACLYNGHIVFTNVSSNTWAGSGVLLSTGTASYTISASNIALSSTLDRIRITTVNGTDTFDAGSVNILFE